MPLKIIKGGNNPKPYRDKDKEPIYCPVCDGNLFVEMISAPLRSKLNWLKRSGERQLICLSCFGKGKIVEV